MLVPDIMDVPCLFPARHLADCKRKSAYPSAERAAQCTLQGQSASFPPLVNLDDEGDNEDHEEKWMRAFTQSRQSNDSSETGDEYKKIVPKSTRGDSFCYLFEIRHC